MDSTKWLARITDGDEKARYIEHIELESKRFKEMRAIQLKELMETGNCKFRMFQYKKFLFRPGTYKLDFGISTECADF